MTSGVTPNRNIVCPASVILHGPCASVSRGG